MRLDELAQAMRDFEERLVQLGVSRAAARKATVDAEVATVADLVETAADQRLLDLFDSIGSAALAERKGLSQRQICRQRLEAMRRLQAKEIGHEVSHLTSAKAA